MAIRLKVQEGASARLSVSSDNVSFRAEQGIPIYPISYAGAYEVTPSAQTQTLDTNGLMMTANVTVNPIPTNYGLITWDGSTLTVS